MSAENLVKHYWDCARVVEPEGHTKKLLKSYYMTKCRKLAKSSIYMPKEKFSPHTMCRSCSSKWNETNYKMFLKPQQIAYSTKARKQIEKLQEAKKSIENRRALTRKQRKRAKWLQKRVLNSVVIQCELCQHETKIEMQKPDKKERDSETVDTADLEESAPTETITPTEVNNKKKKKKNKDKTAGLKIDKSLTNLAKNNEVQTKNNNNSHAVPETITPTEVNNKKKKKKNKDKTARLKIDKSKNLIINNEVQTNNNNNSHAVPTAITRPQPSNNVAAKVKPSDKVVAKPTANLSQTLKAKKQNQKKAKPANTTPKVQSKTQQQNSLLQLAALLKSQTAAKSGANTAQKRLESFLK